MKLIEIQNLSRDQYLSAVERWIDGIDQSNMNNVPLRKELADIIKNYTPSKLAPKCKFLYRAITLPEDVLAELKSVGKIRLHDQGASSWSSTPALASWFFDEILKRNSILIKKPCTSSAILDVNKLRKSMSDEERKKFELLAYGQDSEVIALDTSDYTTITINDVVKSK